jgi:hypothetical protein
LKGKVVTGERDAADDIKITPSSWQRGPARNPIAVKSRKAKAKIAKAVKSLGNSAVPDKPIISTAQLRAAKLATLGWVRYLRTALNN